MQIYLVRNLLNGNCYVGKSKDYLKRFSAHKKAANTGRTRLNQAMKSYGVQNFAVELLEDSIDDSGVDEREKFWIRELKPTYNLTAGGEGGDTSASPHFQHYMKTIRSAQISGDRNPFFGHKHTEEAKKKQSLAKLGKALTAETKIKLSELNRGKKMHQSAIEAGVEKRAKLWRVFYPDGRIKIVKNLSSFCRENELDQRNLSKTSCGLQKFSKGFRCERVVGVKNSLDAFF